MRCQDLPFAPTVGASLGLSFLGALSILLGVAPAYGQTAPVPSSNDNLHTILIEDSSLRDSYGVLEAGTATKTDTPLLETPVSVQVVTQQILKDEQALNLNEALSNVPGVRSSNIGWAENIYLRGFTTSTYFRDGFRIDDPSGLGGLASLANVDSIEVLKGPGAVLYGRVEPGGVVNLVSKQPTETPYHSVSLGIGSWNQYSMALDTGGPINEDKSLRYRFNTSYESSGLWVDNVTDKKVFFSPTVQWKISNDTHASFEAFYLRDKSTLYQQAVVPYDSTNLRFLFGPKSANPAPYQFDPTTLFVGISWSHKFGNNWELRHQISHNRTDFSTPLNLSSAWGPLQQDGNGIWSIGLGSAQLYGDTQSDGTVLDLTGHLTTGFAQHTLLMGADAYRLGAFYNSQYSSPAGPFLTVPLFSSAAPSPNGIPLDPQTYYVTQSVIKSTGVYAQDQIKLGHGIDMLAGLRYQNVSSDGYTNSGPNFGGTGSPAPNPSARESALTPRAGLVWQPTQQWSVYGSYSQNFGASNVSSGTDWQGHLLKPESADQFEAGAKAELFNRNASFSLAWFNLTKTNVAAQDLAHPNGAGGFFVTTIGQIQSKGLELSLQGKFNRDWEGVAAYTYDHAFVKVGTSTYAAGSDMPNVPRQMLKLFSAYQLHAPYLTGWKLGAGMNWESSAPGIYMDPNTYATNTTTITVPSFVTFDAMASYATQLGNKKLSVQLNIKNLANRNYYTDAFMYVAPWGYVTWGAPRSFNLTAQLEF